ncbi:MAG TPA: hypothetical protein VMF65_01525 [Acidimicrobiales bacterium]|nr:hypothetical protein [Acidimicrobiales bacterium]
MLADPGMKGRLRSSAEKRQPRVESWQYAVDVRVPNDPLDYPVTIGEMSAEGNSDISGVVPLVCRRDKIAAAAS